MDSVMETEKDFDSAIVKDSVTVRSKNWDLMMEIPTMTDSN